MTTHVSEAENVRRALHRTALLYQHFAQTLHAELGPEKAKELILHAIYSYGAQIGAEAKARTLAKGLPLTAENYSDDLPTIGWQSQTDLVDGENVTTVSCCPLAEEWKDMDQELAGLYCYVDQAKMQAYNPDLCYVHLSKLLDGDGCCRLVVRKAAEA